MQTKYIFILASFFCLFWGKISAQSNQYLHFDGVNDWVEVPKGSAMVANSSQITMAGWFYTDKLAYGQGMMGIRGDGTGKGEMYVIQLADGKLECRLVTGTTLYEYASPTFTIVPQVWQHVAWVYTGTKIQLYINGTLKGSANATGTIATTDRSFAIGRSIVGGLNFYFGGRVDEVSLWKKALTPTEIKDMMANGLLGTETGLMSYYKCNQGVPGANNTSITMLNSELENATRAGILRNFALDGATSNFNGTLDASFQAISFPTVPNKLVSAAPFDLTATSSAGLPVTYELLSGPATLSGKTITLTGAAGEVKIRATQPGNGAYAAAVPVDASFQVLDPKTHLPEIDARNPIAGDVYVPVLKPIQLAAISSIAYPELFSVNNFQFTINGQTITAKDWGNKHYTAWWTPPAHGDYAVDVIATNNYGFSSKQTVNFRVTEQAATQTTTAFADVWVNVSKGVMEVEGQLPSYLGAFDQIQGNLIIKCPTGGCDPWDRISSVEAKGHNGEWYEIIRYITPYGVACSSKINLTDFMSILQGKIRFRVTLGTFDNGFSYNLNLTYRQGAAAHPYSTISKVWNKTYDFGNPANLQPVKDVNVNFNTASVTSKLKLVSSGHGWGDNNTDNAAEFHDDTHHIWVNGAETFAQRNWQICNPNPDGCSPQNGTWFYNRAGWCPGSIAPWFDFDLTPYVAQKQAKLGYIFDKDYVDLCNANNPNCNTSTCPNCADGYNPHLIVSAYVISTGDVPIDGAEVVGIANPGQANNLDFRVFPNPTQGKVSVEVDGDLNGSATVGIHNALGQMLRVERFEPNAAISLDLAALPKGVYSIHLQAGTKSGMAKVILK